MSEKIEKNRSFQDIEASYSHLISLTSLNSALENIRQIPEYRPSSLLDCASLASKFGLEKLSCKYEGDRFAGGSFKPLGVANAAIEISKRVIKKNLSVHLTANELFKERSQNALKDLTFACATSGNHGYALAWVASRLGATCRIYCPASTSQFRKKRIKSLGATVIEVAASFDDAVAICSKESEVRGDIVVSNLVQDGFEDIPQLIMNGYSVLAQEVLQQVDSPITHIYVGGGGGRLAASIAATFKIGRYENLPKVIVVEPEYSDCIASSIQFGRASATRIQGETMMTGLVVARPSSVSWPILRTEVFATLTISDETAVETLLDLENGYLGNELLPIGETGIAALAGFLRTMRDPIMCSELGINSTSHVLVVACEGVTDPELLNSILIGAGKEKR
ncbi:MAG: diaminopropionate ammonia-lyase [Actinobacteria bacterium]|nr:diaminopropionate ammonia-lyase [Actinomycetota bacterium]